MTINNKGHHIIISIFVIGLSIIGGWSLYQWHKEGTTKQNLTRMLNDFRSGYNTVVTDQADREKIESRIEEIQNILKKYTQKEKTDNR